MTILVFADIVGRIGREALKACLPELRERYAPALVIANAENLAHGSGITVKTVSDLFENGVDYLTGGNHLWDKPGYQEVFADHELAARIVRPLNETKTYPGTGIVQFEKAGRSFALINVMGQVFFKEGTYSSPMDALDKALVEIPKDTITLVDVHCDATSEKAYLGLRYDGRVSAMWGSHTHVPTADERLLPKGSAFTTDVGMCGGYNQSIGVRFEDVDRKWRGEKGTFEPPENGPAEVNAIIFSFDGGVLPNKIERYRKIVDIP